MKKVKNLKPGTQFRSCGKEYVLVKVNECGAKVREVISPKRVNFVDKDGKEHKFVSSMKKKTIVISLETEAELI